MTEPNHVLIVEFFLSVGVAWFVYSYLYKRVRLDAFREKLFTVRDDLFDFMWRNDLTYGGPGQATQPHERAYRLLRSSLNGMIRSADDGNFNLITVWVASRAINDPKAVARAMRIREAINAVEDSNVRDYFGQVYTRVGLMSFRHVWLEGPLSLVLTPALIVRLVLKEEWKRQEWKEEFAEVGVELDRQERSDLSPQAA